jgi:hypothetical protein
MENTMDIFFTVDSAHFRFKIRDRNTSYKEIAVQQPERRIYIPLSSFDDNNKLNVYFESSVIGLYTLDFYIQDTQEKNIHVIENGT